MASAADPSRAPAQPRPSWAGPRAIGLGLLALGVVTLVATAAIPAGRDGWSMTGARFFPLIASIGLIGCALAQLVRATLLPDVELGRHAAEEARATDLRTPAAVAALLVVYTLALEPVGYLLTTAVFLPVAARALGSDRPRRDAISGVAFSLLAYSLFTQALAVPLPIGILGF